VRSFSSKSFSAAVLVLPAAGFIYAKEFVAIAVGKLALKINYGIGSINNHANIQFKQFFTRKSGSATPGICHPKIQKNDRNFKSKLIP
jgi:hypothetical protein